MGLNAMQDTPEEQRSDPALGKERRPAGVGRHSAPPDPQSLKVVGAEIEARLSEGHRHSARPSQRTSIQQDCPDEARGGYTVVRKTYQGVYATPGELCAAGAAGGLSTEDRDCVRWGYSVPCEFNSYGYSAIPREPNSEDPARTVFTEQEMKERILVVVEQQHQLKLYDEKHWTNALVQKAGGKWCISGVDKGGKTISREGATAEIIAEAMKGLGLQELRVFGMRPRRSGSPVSELARRSHNTWNSSCIDRTFDENSGAGPHRYILERPSVNDGTRFGVRNKYEIDEYGLTDGRAGRRHFDPVSSFQESGMTIREDAPTTTPETPHRPEAAGHQPPVFFGGRWTSFHPTISVGDEGVRRKFIKAPHHYMKPDWWWEDRDRRVSTGPNPKNYENQEPTPRAKK